MSENISSMFPVDFLHLILQIVSLCDHPVVNLVIMWYVLKPLPNKDVYANKYLKDYVVN